MECCCCVTLPVHAHPERRCTNATQQHVSPIHNQRSSFHDHAHYTFSYAIHSISVTWSLTPSSLCLYDVPKIPSLQLISQWSLTSGIYGSKHSRKRHGMTQFGLYMNYFMLGTQIHAYMTNSFTLLSLIVGASWS